jgi:hypothetical protein
MSHKVQLAVAWVIAAVIAAGVVGVLMLRFAPQKTEAPPPAPLAVPVEDKPAPKPPPVEDKQAQRWVCSHTTRQTVTILTGASGAFQAYMDQCDEWKLK